MSCKGEESMHNNFFKPNFESTMRSFFIPFFFVVTHFSHGLRWKEKGIRGLLEEPSKSTMGTQIKYAFNLLTKFFLISTTAKCLVNKVP